MTDYNFNRLIEEFQLNRGKAKNILKKYMINIELDEFLSEYVVFLMKNKNNPAYDYIDNYESYCMKILNHIAFSYNQKESLFNNTKDYSWYNTMKKISTKYNIPLTCHNAYIFTALCDIPALTTRKAYTLIETGGMDDIRYQSEALDKYGLSDSVSNDDM